MSMAAPVAHETGCGELVRPRVPIDVGQAPTTTRQPRAEDGVADTAEQRRLEAQRRVDLSVAVQDPRDHDPRAVGAHRAPHRVHGSRVEAHVGVEHEHRSSVGATHPHAHVDATCVADVAVPVDRFQSSAPHDLTRLVGGAVVDDDRAHLRRAALARQVVEQRRHVRRAVVGDDDAVMRGRLGPDADPIDDGTWRGTVATAGAAPGPGAGAGPAANTRTSR